MVYHSSLLIVVPFPLRTGMIALRTISYQVRTCSFSPIEMHFCLQSVFVTMHRQDFGEVSWCENVIIGNCKICFDTFLVCDMCGLAAAFAGRKFQVQVFYKSSCGFTQIEKTCQLWDPRNSSTLIFASCVWWMNNKCHGHKYLDLSCYRVCSCSCTILSKAFFYPPYDQ